MSAFARSYAQAFLAAAPAGYDVEGFLASADAIRGAISSQPKLRAFFAAPAVPAEAKRKALDELARKASVDEFGQRFLRLVLQNRRLLGLAIILTTLRDEADRRRGVVFAHVTVAAPLAEAEQGQIAQALSRVVKRSVRLTTEVKEEILGGFVARVGSEVFDASVRRAIEQFQQRASEEAKV